MHMSGKRIFVQDEQRSHPASSYLCKEVQMGHQDTPVSRGAKTWWSTEGMRHRGSVCICSCIFLPLALLCRETKDCQDHEALQVLWESQAI